MQYIFKFAPIINIERQKLMKVNTKELDIRLSSAENIAIVGHLNPDGDCVGSVTAMYHYLTGRGLNARIVFPSEVPHTLEFILPKTQGAVTILSEDKSRTEDIIKASDLIICLDLNQLSRTDELADHISAAKVPMILIDHHIEVNDDKFDLKYVSTNVSSACELLFGILLAMPDIDGNLENITIECATSLFTGMMTDTNNFSNSVFPETLIMASELLSRGVDRDHIQTEVFQSFAEGRLRLLGHLLQDKLVVMHDERSAYMTLSLDEKKAYGIIPGDTEGFVNYPLSIADVDISAMFTEDDSRQFVRVSLRSKGTTDVNTLARQSFNGGGHKNAAGGRLFIPIAEVPSYFEKALKEYLRKK